MARFTIGNALPLHLHSQILRIPSSSARTSQSTQIARIVQSNNGDTHTHTHMYVSSLLLCIILASCVLCEVRAGLEEIVDDVNTHTHMCVCVFYAKCIILTDIYQNRNMPF